MKHTIITIGRQFGSHGRSIAKQLAKKLGYAYYDKELLVKASQESGLATSFLESMDERQASPFFYSLLAGPTQFMWNDQFISTEAMAYQAQHDTILKVAQEGNCVIVGRCADHILKDQERLVRVFISADLKDRIAHVMERDQITEKEARKKIKEMDKSRAAYYNFNTDQKWSDAANYDLCINTSRLTEEKTVETILHFIHNLLD